MSHELLGGAALDAALQAVPAWTRKDAVIVRTVRMPSFRQALDAVVAVGEAAERAAHHPDIDIRYATVTFSLTTHDAGGLTEADFALARAIDGIVEGIAAL